MAPTRSKKRKIEEVNSLDEAKGDAPSFWLFKSEPESRIVDGVDVKFGIDDLMGEPDLTACWDGVRNYQVFDMTFFQ